MYAKKLGMFVILSLSIATVVMGTAGLNLVSPVFAGGDHHDHGGKKECKKNDNNNCNDTEKNKNYRQRLNVKTKTQSKIIVTTMRTTISWYAVLTQRMSKIHY